MGKFRQILTELSARDMPIFSFPDDNLCKYKGILIKLGTCIDIRRSGLYRKAVQVYHIPITTTVHAWILIRTAILFSTRNIGYCNAMILIRYWQPLLFTNL